MAKQTRLLNPVRRPVTAARAFSPGPVPRAGKSPVRRSPFTIALPRPGK